MRVLGFGKIVRIIVLVSICVVGVDSVIWEFNYFFWR